MYEVGRAVDTQERAVADAGCRGHHAAVREEGDRVDGDALRRNYIGP